MSPDDIVTYDWETEVIDQRPNFPPRPVGLAVKWGSEPGFYMAFGHPSGNNCTVADAMQMLQRIWASGRRVLAFNAKYDMQVATEKCGAPVLDWSQFDDAMYLAFLNNPHARNLDLKGLCEDLLNWPPEERDAVSDYVWENRKALKAQYPGTNVSRSKGKVSKIYEWFSRVPGDVLEPYAVGDVERTYALFQFLYPKIVAAGMLPAYDRLRRITPILMENERVGMRVDTARLQADIFQYRAAFEQVERALAHRLGVPNLNFDADADVAAALSAAGIVDDDKWTLTDTGQKSMAKDNLKPSMFNDPQVASALGYRNRLATCLKMFMEPWLDQARVNNGYITTNWNITRGEGGGTRTGRPSTNNHNFLNLSKEFDEKGDGYEHPAFLGLPELPLVRSYVIADEGHVLLGRDFAGQELRVYAHFEGGELHAAYNADPNVDPHAIVGAKMTEMMGKPFPRGKVKILNFQALYGGGVPAAAQKLDCSLAEAKEFKAFHDIALSGRKPLADAIKGVFTSRQPIMTLGGRLYYCEPAGYSKKFDKFMSYEYKGINYIVQGSAADLTIEAILDWYHDPRRDPRCRFMLQVYDEIVLSCPEEVAAQQMQVLKEAMEKPRLTVPMLSEGEMGRSWGEMEACA